MENILERLKNGEVLVCDGAMGTMLQTEGLKAEESPELWNLQKPDIVLQVHKAYIKAGSDIIITNTFGANPIKLERAGLKEKFNDINSESVKIAKKAAGDNVYVFGDTGPTGELLEPLGDCSYKKAYDSYKAQAVLLARCGVDAIIIETMSDLQEIKAAIEAAKVTKLPIVASIAFQASKKGYRTMMGVSVQDATSKMIEFGADVIGANCGCDVNAMNEIVSDMRKASKDKPIVVQPNAGMPVLKSGKAVFPQGPEDFADGAHELISKKLVNIIGGCCGTTPAHINALKKCLGIGSTGY